MIKVCHITSVHNRHDIRIFQKECCSLVDAGYEVVLLVCDEKKDEIYKGVHIKSLGFKPQTRWNRVWKADAAIIAYALQEKANIYHFHDPELLRYAKKIHKTKATVIFDSHEFYALQFLTKDYIPKVFRKYVKNIYQHFEKKWLQFVDAVIVPCTLDEKNYFEGRAKRTCYIANMPSLKEFYEIYDEAQEKEKMVCQAGSLSYSRGVLHLVKAMEKIDAILVLAGVFDSNDFKKKLKTMDAYSKVEYRGRLTRQEICKLYQAASVGMSTMLDMGQYYHIDTLATKTYEYMAMGVPVVLSDTPYAKKVLEQYPFGIAVNGAVPDEIAVAVNYLLNHPEQAKKMGEAGRCAIKERFHWEKEAEKLKKLYQDLVEASMEDIS